MRDSSAAPFTDSIPKSRGERDAQSSIAWERVMDRLRLRLKGRPSRTAIFGRAGLRHGKMHWMRLQPDLRASVVVKLSKALRVTPATFFRMMVLESKPARPSRPRIREPREPRSGTTPFSIPDMGGDE